MKPIQVGEPDLISNFLSIIFSKQLEPCYRFPFASKSFPSLISHQHGREQAKWEGLVREQSATPGA